MIAAAGDAYRHPTRSERVTRKDACCGGGGGARIITTPSLPRGRRSAGISPSVRLSVCMRANFAGITIEK